MALKKKPFLAQIRFNPRLRHSKHFIFMKEKGKRKIEEDKLTLH